MLMIVGLGNPGEKYELTRHNLGFRAVERLAEKLSTGPPKWNFEKKFNAEVFRPTNEIILVKPQTFMNASGFAILKILGYYHIKIVDLWVIHDDLDLPLGKIKIAVARGSAGHRGIESIIEEAGDNSFVRFRLGIGAPLKKTNTEDETDKKRIKKEEKHHRVEKFVLEEFSSKEEAEIEKMIKKTIKIIDYAQKSGIEKAMIRYNLG